MSRGTSIAYDPWAPVKITDVYAHDDAGQSVAIAQRRAVSVYDEEGTLHTPSSNIVGSAYPLIENTRVRDIALDVMDRADLQYEESGMLFNGSRFRQDFNIMNSSITPVDDDELGLRCTVLNSYDGSTRFAVLFNAWRLICSNGMEINHLLGGFRFKHAGGIELDDEIKRATEELHLRSYNMKTLSNKVVELNSTQLTPHQVSSTMNRLQISDTLAGEAMMNLEGDTMWSLYNAFTFVLSRRHNFTGFATNKKISEYFFGKEVT